MKFGQIESKLMAKTTKIPITKDMAYFQFCRSQNEKRKIKTMIANSTKRLAFLDFFEPFSCIRKTCKGETYQVPNKGVSANNTDIKRPSKSPNMIG